MAIPRELNLTNQPVYTPSGELLGNRSIQDIQANSGDASALLNRGTQQTSQIASNTPVQNFNLRLMDMLKQYQSLGTAPFVQQQFNAQNAQTDASNSALLNPALKGYAPSTIMNAGQNAEQPFNPTIQGAQKSAQTFGEQLQGFGTAVDKAQSLVQQFQQQQKDDEMKANAQRDDARAVINEILSSTDPASLRKLNPDDLAALEKASGYPKGFLSSAVTYKQQQADAAEAKLKAAGGGLGTDTGNASGNAIGTTGSGVINTKIEGYASAIVPGTGGLTQAAIDQDALATALGQPLPVPLGLSSSGPGGQKRTAINNRMAELNAGGNVATNKSKLIALTQALKTQTEYNANIDRALNGAEMGAQLTQTLFSNKGINPFDSTIANETLNNLTKKFGDSGDIRAYQAAMTEIGNEYAQVFARGGARSVEGNAIALNLINGNVKLADIAKTLDTLQQIGQTVKQTSGDELDRISGQINNIVGGAPAPEANAPNFESNTGQSMYVNPSGSSSVGGNSNTSGTLPSGVTWTMTP